MDDMKLMETMQIPIRWSDMDSFGHVNNAMYFTYMESVRFSWISKLMAAAALPEGEGPVIVNAQCTYLRQLVFPGDVEIKVFAAPPGRSSVETRYEFRRAGQPEVLHAEGTAKVVWINFAQQKSVPWPAAILELMARAV